MKRKVHFIGDVSRAGQAGNIRKLYWLFSPVFKQMDVECLLHISQVNESTDLQENIGAWKASLDGSGVSPLKDLDLEDVAVIAFEAAPRDLDYLTERNVSWVNLAIHPLRFLDDLYFEVTTSFDFDVQPLAASSEWIALCANAIRMKSAGGISEKHESSLLILGQTPIDKSVWFDGTFKGLNDYVEQIDQLAKDHARVYYRPHPNLTNPVLDEEICCRYGATVVADRDIYGLLCSGNFATVCAISSSVIAEAPWFGLCGELLETRAKRFGPPISYSRLLNAHGFWSSGLLEGECGSDTWAIVDAVPANFLRNAFEYWGYVTPEREMREKVRELESKMDARDFIARIEAEGRVAAAEAEAKAQQAEAKAQQAEAKAQQAEAKAQQAEAKAQQAEAKAQQAEAKAQQAEAKAQQAEAHSNEILSSRSWRVTAPLRHITYQLQRLLSRFRRVAKSIVVRSILLMQPIVLHNNTLRQSALFFLNKFPRLKHRVRSALFRRATSVVEQSLRPVEAVATEYFLPEDERAVLFYVEHTATFDRITGIQRVCHKLSAMLESGGEVLILVKLDHSTLNLIPLSSDERRHFLTMSGRRLEDQKYRLDDPAVFQRFMGSLRSQPRHPWLIIPEIPYHTTHATPPTSRLIKLARDFGLRVGVVFYDVIPFLTKDAAENAGKHANYMSTVALADVIWPISFYSSSLMVDYYRRYEKLNEAEMPIISVATLAGEMDTPREIGRNPNIGQNIVCVGTIDERKNQITLIKAFNRYCEEHREAHWTLNLVGMVRNNYKQIIEKEAAGNPRIKFNYNARDEDIRRFYMNCDFTVFPSLEEGYGLPIIESLWNIRPCICANFGSMAELSVDGGCVTVDTSSADALHSAITDLIEDQDLYQQKVKEIIRRPVKTWYEYAREIASDMDRLQFGRRYDGLIYYWIDATLAANGNTGIQRVNRQLAKQLIQQGHKVVPLKWDEQRRCVVFATDEDLDYMALWNGPAQDGWHLSADLDQIGNNATYLMVDLPLNRPLDIQRQVIDFFKARSVKCAAIFYDAIPHKLATLYPPHFSDAHRAYMDLLDKMDLIVPISVTSANDLRAFLDTSHCRALSLEERIKTVDLPSAFSENARTIDRKPTLADDCCRILVVGTVEPRKNHTTLIKAFFEAEKKSNRKLKLTLVGGDESFDNELPHVVRGLIGEATNIDWVKKASDDILRQQYEQADFTVFPSYEEGFGLPIVESLWFGVPCICAGYSQMAELASHGGCVPVDVLSVEELSNAIADLANTPAQMERLKAEIRNRYFKTWEDYAAEVSSSIRSICQNPDMPVIAVEKETPYNLPCQPILSVCITTYNRAGWLDINLRNLMKISVSLRDRIEIVVCDNCSSDETPQIVEGYLEEDGFAYIRNSGNIGMLGNLPQTVSSARGDYIWLIGDDDLIHEGALKKILHIVQYEQPDLINVNYSYSADPSPPRPETLSEYLSKATKICDGNKSGPNTVKYISAFNENFYTAIYTFVVKRKHAQRIFTQDTSGAPFSSLQTCVPSSKYILSHLMELPGYWVDEPLITINMHVSWGKYAPLWILERVPEVYDLAELNGVAKDQADRWRRHTLEMALTYFKILFESESDVANDSFDIIRFIRRFRHLREFQGNAAQFETVYANALENNHPLAKVSLDTVRAAMR
ncbi:MAG: glycosyltransferase [Gammaproteobacteria bacterium]|nr:glycosyltransferase [Gammaproteobacteria bacterium]MBU1415555.1 glycosyltransferase [Gammaproteobacteria bacterium]